MTCKTLLAFSLFGSLCVVGCGGSGSSGGGTPPPASPTITSVSVSCNPTSVQTGQTSQCSATVMGTGSYATTVTWSANSGTISSSGLYTASATVPASGAATITATSTQDATKTGTAAITVTTAAPVQPTATLTASPSTITVGSSTTLTWSCTNATSATASGAWSGTEATSGSTTETPSATATYSLKCTGADGSATASATVTVNAAPLPDISSVSTDTMFVDWSNTSVAGVYLNGDNFTNTDTVYASEFNNILSETLVSSTQIALELQFGATAYSPGWLTFAICENSNDTNCGTSQTIAFLGAQNYLAASSSGELFFLDQAQGAPSGQNGYVRKYKADGTADGSFFVGALTHSIAVDNKTGNVLADGYDYDENGGATVPYPTQPASQDPVMAVAAENGYGCFAQPANNSASCYNLVGGDIAAPVVTASNLGNKPEAIAMALFGTETDAFVVSIDGTPSLYKVRASDAKVEGSLPLPGVTPASTVVAANLLAGGSQVIVFSSGPASGTAVVLSTYDHLLLFVNANTMKITKQVVLTDTPFRITADVTHGAVIVAYANPANVTTTYASVDMASGTVTPLLNTSSLLSVGLAVNSSGTNIYSGQRNQIEVKQNQ